MSSTSREVKLLGQTKAILPLKYGIHKGRFIRVLFEGGFELWDVKDGCIKTILVDIGPNERSPNDLYQLQNGNLCGIIPPVKRGDPSYKVVWDEHGCLIEKSSARSYACISHARSQQICANMPIGFTGCDIWTDVDFSSWWTYKWVFKLENYKVCIHSEKMLITFEI